MIGNKFLALVWMIASIFIYVSTGNDQLTMVAFVVSNIHSAIAISKEN